MLESFTSTLTYSVLTRNLIAKILIVPCAFLIISSAAYADHRWHDINTNGQNSPAGIAASIAQSSASMSQSAWRPDPIYWLSHQRPINQRPTHAGKVDSDGILSPGEIPNPLISYNQPRRPKNHHPVYSYPNFKYPTYDRYGKRPCEEAEHTDYRYPPNYWFIRKR